LIWTAGFLVLNPGTIIKPHCGVSSDVLRCHLGIKVPEGDCCLRVDGEILKWHNGKVIIFDDTRQHEAWNMTSESRVILLLDLIRSHLLL
jgi:beta-hydroxylase